MFQVVIMIKSSRLMANNLVPYYIKLATRLDLAALLKMWNTMGPKHYRFFLVYIIPQEYGAHLVEHFGLKLVMPRRWLLENINDGKLKLLQMSLGSFFLLVPEDIILNNRTKRSHWNITCKSTDQKCLN